MRHVLLLFIVGCDSTTVPTKKEFDGHYDGAVTLVASGASLGAWGYASVAKELAIDIKDDGWDSTTKSIAVTIGDGCVLKGTWIERARDTSRGTDVSFLFGTAQIDPSQTCTFGALTTSVSFGTAYVDLAGDLSIDLVGTLSSFDGAMTTGTATIAYRGRSPMPKVK